MDTLQIMALISYKITLFVICSRWVWQVPYFSPHLRYTHISPFLTSFHLHLKGFSKHDFPSQIHPKILPYKSLIPFSRSGRSSEWKSPWRGPCRQAISPHPRWWGWWRAKWSPTRSTRTSSRLIRLLKGFKDAELRVRRGRWGQPAKLPRITLVR